MMFNYFRSPDSWCQLLIWWYFYLQKWIIFETQTFSYQITVALLQVNPDELFINEQTKWLLWYIYLIVHLWN